MSFLKVLVVVAGLVLFSSPAISAICDADQLCPTNPCTIHGTHFIGCDLDFGDKDVTIAPDGELRFVINGGSTISAGNLTLRGSISAVNVEFNIFVNNDFVMEPEEGEADLQHGGRINIYAGPGFTFCTLDIEAGGRVVLGGSFVKAQCGGFAQVTAFGQSIDVNSPIWTRMPSPDEEATTTIELDASPGSIRVTKRLSAKGLGRGNAATIVMNADGDISLEGPLNLVNGGGVGGSGVFLFAGSNVFIQDRIKLSPFGSVGIVQVGAGGSIFVDENIEAAGLSRPGIFFGRGDVPGTGGQVMLRAGDAIVVKKTINASCEGGPLKNCFANNFQSTIDATCSTDLTGAELDARGNLPILLGCPCVHRPGNTCDGGCIGLDQATIIPPLPSSLPLCPPE
jgi:hypothetical protein